MNATQPTVFGDVDYGVFGTMLTISLAIGIYFGFFGKGATSTVQYLLGGRQMQIVPVAVSLIASQVNSNTFLLLPIEMYNFGTQYIMIAPTMLITALIIVFVTLPVLYNCNIENTYQYLELRFDSKVRKIVTLFFVLMTIGMAPIISFVPALAFSHVSGLNVHFINIIVSIIITTYTMLGGIKAVIWTDVVQSLVMITSCIVVLVLGLINIGGIELSWQRAEDGKRIQFFNMDLSVTTRHSFWNQLFNAIVLHLGYTCFNQTSVQRLMSVPSLKQAKRVVCVFALGYALLILMNCFIGIVMYATYHKCDPIKAGIITHGNKLVPYFVMDIIGHLPGIPGLFIAAVFSASLSTISAQFNSVAGIIHHDVIKKIEFFNHKKVKANLYMQVIIVGLGVFNILTGFLVEKFQDTFQIVITILSLTLGATTGVFTLGMLTPWANNIGALYGSIASILIVGWIVIGGQLAVINGSISYRHLPTSVEECDIANKTFVDTQTNFSLITSVSTVIADDVFFLYKLSFNYYAVASLLIVWMVGLIISFITGPPKPKQLEKKLFASCIHWILPKIENDDCSTPN